MFFRYLFFTFGVFFFGTSGHSTSGLSTDIPGGFSTKMADARRYIKPFLSPSRLEQCSVFSGEVSLLIW